MFELFLTSVVVGIAVTAPPGPVAALTIARTLRDGYLAGLLSGLGVAIGDAVLAWITLVVLGAAVDPDWSGQRWLAAAAVPVLVWLAVLFFKRARKGAELTTEPADAHLGLTAGKSARYVGTTLALAWTTPGTIPGLVALFSAAGLTSKTVQGLGAVTLVCGGVLIGAMAWWAGLCGLIARLRDRVHRYLRWVDVLSGVLTLIAAGYAGWVAIVGR